MSSVSVRKARKAANRYKAQSPKPERQPIRTGQPEAKAPTARMDGLKWLMTRNPPRLTQEQYLIGRKYGDICGEAARAEMPGRANVGMGGGFGSRTPSQGALDAVRAKIDADDRFDVFPEADARTFVQLMESVCHHGFTLREIAIVEVAEDQRRQGLADSPAAAIQHRSIALEERLKVGLSVLRHLVNDPAPRRIHPFEPAHLAAAE